MASEDWSKRVLEHWDLLDKLARSRFPDNSLADEALLYVEQKLADDDWRRVRAFKGDASFATFLCFVARRLLEDFCRHRFGRMRPPGWLVACGPLWERIYRLLCLERNTVDDTVHSIQTSFPGDLTNAAVEEAIEAVLSRIPDCGKSTGEISTDNTELLDSHLPPDPGLHRRSPEEIMEIQEREAFLGALSCCMTTGSETEPSLPPDDKIKTLFQRVRSAIHLTVEERLFLKMIFRDGLNVVAAGRQLGWSSNQAHGKLRRVLENLRNAFKSAGLDEDLRDLVKTEPEL